MEILHLTLNKEWFDLIACGKKIFEYREYKKHWISRLIDNGTKNFDEVHFRNGYGSDKPFMRVKFIGMGILNGINIKPENSEPIDSNKKYFVIGLGEILETANLSPAGKAN